MLRESQRNRKAREQEIKQQLKQILHSVKGQKQYIQNQLNRNDQKIKDYCAQFQRIKDEDFDQLSQQQIKIVSSLKDGLESEGINPTKIFGEETLKLCKISVKEELQSGLGNNEVIKVQELLIKKLLAAIQLKKNQVKSNKQQKI